MNSIEYPEVTVLMSVYKPKEEYLRFAIESILSQSFSNFEFLIIIDGIDKNVLSIVESYSDTRINIHQNKENIGLTKSLNIGLKIAKGKYIARMDADDISLKNRLEKQYKYMEKNKEIAVVGSYAKNIGQKGLTRQLHSSDSDVLKIRMMFYNAGIIHPTAFIRKEFIHKYNITYDETIKKSQDYAFWMEVLNYGEIKLIPEILLHYRVHEGQITNLNNCEIEKYTNLIAIRQWTKLGIEFNETEQRLLRSISTSKVIKNPMRYKIFFENITDWNNKAHHFDKKLLNAEVSRLWLHLALKNIKYNHNHEMLFDKRTLRIMNLSTLIYILKFYIIEKYKPYLTLKL